MTTQQIVFTFDLTRCSGCMACVVACMDQNDISDDGPSFRQVSQLEKGEYPSASVSFVSLACFHCSDAPCMAVCPKGAISRNPDQCGAIDVDDDLCIGCRVCAMVCPFGAPKFRAGEKMSKCNFCSERVANGNGMEPACVRTCPTKALGFGTTEELSKKKSEKASLKIIDSMASVQVFKG